MQERASKSGSMILWCLAIGAIGLVLIGCSDSTGPKEVPAPWAKLSVDSDSCSAGGICVVAVRFEQTDPNHPKVDSLSGFDILLAYDPDVLMFIGPAKRGEGISAWEYFTYRSGRAKACDTCYQGALRLQATRDLNNSISPNPPQLTPNGVISWLRFEVTLDMSVVGDSLEIGFSLRDWTDNSISREGNQNILYIPDTRIGRATDIAGYDTSHAPRLYRLEPILMLQSGWIHVQPPIFVNGDLDLDGIAFEVHDAVIFANYFSKGYAAFDPQRASEQIAAADCDGDGEPLTRADFERMVRTIAGPLVWDTLEVPYADTLYIVPKAVGNHWVLMCQSTTQVDELWLRILSTPSAETLRYLGDSSVVVSHSISDGHLQASCGTVNGHPVFGTQLEDRFELWGGNPSWLALEAQASRYPGVSMVVRVGPFTRPAHP